MSNKNPLKEPTNSTKKPAPTVPIIAARVPAVLDIPIQEHKWMLKLYYKLLSKQILFNVWHMNVSYIYTFIYSFAERRKQTYHAGHQNIVGQFPVDTRKLISQIFGNITNELAENM